MTMKTYLKGRIAFHTLTINNPRTNTALSASSARIRQRNKVELTMIEIAEEEAKAKTKGQTTCRQDDGS